MGSVPAAERAAAAKRSRVFRDRLYECFGRRANALFGICDAIVTAGLAPSAT